MLPYPHSPAHTTQKHQAHETPIFVKEEGKCFEKGKWSTFFHSLLYWNSVLQGVLMFLEAIQIFTQPGVWM